MIRRRILSALLLIAPTGAVLGGDWQLVVEDSGVRRVEAVGEATVDERAVPARVALACQPTERGTLAWSLSVDRASELGFDFDAFEGPDAPAAAERLGLLAVEGGLLQPRFATPLAGGYGDSDRFVFELSAPASSASDGALLADSIGPQSIALNWQVSSASDRTRQLRARFALDTAAPAIREAMLGCGPPPVIDEALRERWRGQRPLAIGFFDERTVRWRLAGLLGVRLPDVLERLRSAGSIDVEGETVFVLAPAADDPQGGVVLMLAGDEAEVVLLVSGRVERISRRSAGIRAPEAVREFVAARSGTG